jgi:hypothetical protein
MILSIISISGKTLPAHNFWRVAAVWSVLLVPLTAYTISSLKRLSFLRRGIRVHIIFLIMLLIQFTLNAYSFFELNAKRYTLNEKDMITGKYLVSFLDKADSRILIESVPTYEHFNISLASQHPFKFIYSEESKLQPYKQERYLDIPINYFLVKSFSKKRSLKRDQTMTQVLEINNWTLFRKKY